MLTDDHAVLAQTAGASYSIMNAMMYQYYLHPEIELQNCLIRTIASLNFQSMRRYRRRAFARHWHEPSNPLASFLTGCSTRTYSILYYAAVQTQTVSQIQTLFVHTVSQPQITPACRQAIPSHGRRPLQRNVRLYHFTAADHSSMPSSHTLSRPQITPAQRHAIPFHSSNPYRFLASV